MSLPSAPYSPLNPIMGGWVSGSDCTQTLDGSWVKYICRPLSTAVGWPLVCIDEKLNVALSLQKIGCHYCILTPPFFLCSLTFVSLLFLSSRLPFCWNHSFINKLETWSLYCKDTILLTSPFSVCKLDVKMSGVTASRLIINPEYLCSQYTYMKLTY